MTNIINFPRRLRVVPSIPLAHPDIRAAQAAFETETQRHERLLDEADALLLRAAELREARLAMAMQEWPFGRSKA